MSLMDFIDDPTGTKGYRKGMKAKAEAENALLAQARSRTEQIGQGFTDAAARQSQGYDVYSDAAPGAFQNLNTLAGAPTPEYGGTQYKKTVADFLDPSMDYQIQQASNAIQGGAAAQGNLLSGAAQKQLADRAQSIGSMEYGKAYDRMFADRGYMTAEEREKYNSQLQGNQLQYNRCLL